jgi:HK97 family phage major capsid protein
MSKRDIVADLLAKRADANAALTALADKAKDEKRALDQTETADFDRHEADIRALDERLTELDAQIRADEAAEALQRKYAAKPGEGVTREPSTYRSGYGGQSYFRDLHMVRKTGDRDALARLQRNDKEVAEKRALSTTNGAGGEFVPPLWLEDEFVKIARPGRVTANLTPTRPLPPGTDSINVPKVTGGTAVATQATQNSGVNVQDLTTGSISSGVTTIAGGQTVSLQLIEQSPLNVDDIVLGDLAADYAVKLNTKVLSGAGTGGDPTGIFALSGTNAITFTSASPTVAALYTKLAGAVQAIHSARYLPPDTIIMHPSRWAWIVSQFDSSNRPLVVPAAQGPMNAVGTTGEPAAQGYVGSMLGLPVYVDATITTTFGAGTNQDRILVARMSDLMLWESNLRAETFEQTYANQLSVFIRVYNYMSFQAGRYPKSISVIDGTGLVAPTF